VLVANAESIAPAAKALHDAHKSCLIANSICAEVFLEPKIECRNA